MPFRNIHKGTTYNRPIPRYDEIQYPLLQHLADGAVVKKADLEQPMGDHFGLTDAERVEEYPSKNGTVFYDRISWALSYLSMAGLLGRPRRAHYQITELGRQFVGNPEGMRAEVDRRIAEREATRRAKAAEQGQAVEPTGSALADSSADVTPQEAIYNAAESRRSATSSR